MGIRQVRIWNPETNQFVFSGRTPMMQSEFWIRTADLQSPYEYDTGLKDSKGVEIWEGDIVEHEDTYGDNPPEFSKFEVKFANGSFYLSYMGDDGDSDYDCDILIQPIAVIGSIHDKEKA